ncbi:NAD-dependent epimerase/dehydratase family protein [Vibrio sp. N418]|uniref:NAD-dependent epimerase/dehydratase family protein n=1 Tax=Vibrio sp. (strain N418) TaxID=701176 RepID=UPI00031E815F|nr:SDR family oxidoreductase [Vibrio sp. N418]
MTGASGFLGKEIKAYYLATGNDVITIGRSNTDTIIVDLLTLDIDKLATEVGNIDTIVHCAAVNEVDINKSIDITYGINVTLTRKLTELAEKINVKSFVYISTFHVYGVTKGIISQKCEINPINDYGLTHYLSEEIIRAKSNGGSFKYLIIRPTNIYGTPSDFEGFNRWSLVPFQFLKSAYLDRKITINSSGQQYRNFVSINDVIQCLDLIGKEKVVNAFGETEMSIANFARIIGSIVGKYGDTNINVEVLGKQELGDYKLEVVNDDSIYTPSPCQLDSFVKSMIEVKEQWRK